WWTAQHAKRGHVMVPGLPAYAMVDLLQVIAPEAFDTPGAIQSIGVRMGEKLSEVMMTGYELECALVYSAIGASGLAATDLVYSIPPLAPSWPIPGDWLAPPGYRVRCC